MGYLVIWGFVGLFVAVIGFLDFSGFGFTCFVRVYYGFVLLICAWFELIGGCFEGLWVLFKCWCFVGGVCCLVMISVVCAF